MISRTLSLSNVRYEQTKTHVMKRWGALLFLFLFSFFASAQTSVEERTSNQIETVEKQKIKIFPNPATNVVNVLGLLNTPKASISISDVYGNEVLQLQREIRNKALSIPIPNLESGFFVIRITSEEQQVQAKFYKQ